MTKPHPKFRPSKPTSGTPRVKPGLTENAKATRREVYDYLHSNCPRAIMRLGIIPESLLQFVGPEDWLHIGICLLIENKYSGLKYYHANSEGKAGYVAQLKKKYMGVAPGFSDLEIQDLAQTRNLYMEIKVKPNKLTPDQKRFIDHQRSRGHMAEVAYTMQQADAILNHYTKIEP